MIIADFGLRGPRDPAGIFLGKGLTDLLDPINIVHKGEGDRNAEAAAAAAAARKANAPGFAVCPEGKIVNPQWAQILALPADQRDDAKAQAAAAGVQACIDDPKTTKKGTATGCHFIVGSQKFPCSSSGFDDAVAAARARAQQTGNRSFVLRFKTDKGSKTVHMDACVTPQGNVSTSMISPAVAAAAGVIPATQSSPGNFTCPTGYVVARNASDQVVCAPPAAIAAAKKAASRTAARGRSRTPVRGRATRGRGIRGAGLGDYLSLVQSTARYAAPITRAATRLAVPLTYGPPVPKWMAARLPPPSMIQAFGGRSK